MELLTIQDAEALGEKHYKQHNAITSGRYDFTACQLDILFMILSSLEDDKLTYTIRAKDIELLTGREWNYQQLKNSTIDIGSRVFEIETDTTYEQIWLFQKVKYLKGFGAFEVMISEPAKPLFFELKNNFTHFQLKSVLCCTSSYAKRLYMLACQWRTVGKFPRPIPIIELKQMLGLVDKKGNQQYERISQFQERVLDVAKKQINEHTDISFDYELYKRGRSYEYIQIFVSMSKDKPKQLEIDFNKSVNEQKNIRTVVAYGLSEEYATLIVKDGYDEFIKFVDKVNERARKGEIKVENAPAYIIGAYQKKGVLPKS
ncbi:replication initiation protein [Sphingobacterium mizutaii]|uniref:replication initiation protein n=1 Tax=Sphingobacterium mizutaii TaxID=1010 RepID=UPI001625166D|nr:replication initiation protein [Sphingobacterium mizutaii]